MKEFIFFTTEGFTYDKNHKKITNMQILGSAEGKNILEAFKNFKISHSYLLSDYEFKEVIANEIVGGFIKNLEL
ncbi:MAG: hypothetical protein PHF17_03935 [Arcobacteraceae bacterium]|nr:hypothetical protein [Arcobacteraceae bacterium]